MSFILGIDIGWSPTRPTCGIAWQGDEGLFRIRHPSSYLNDIHCDAATLNELIVRLEWFAANRANLLRNSTIVIDGPLGEQARRFHTRTVDQNCGRGEFYRRVQPTHLTQHQGHDFVAATYSVVNAMSANAQEHIWTGRTPMGSGTVIVEANPTVALAVLVPQQLPATLPTRSRGLPAPGGIIRAKSDWYWRLGANRTVADRLEAHDAEGELNHEKVAALTCLAVAKDLADGGRAIIGTVDGIYAFLREADETWRTAITAAGGQGFSFPRTQAPQPDQPGMTRTLNLA